MKKTLLTLVLVALSFVFVYAQKQYPEMFTPNFDNYFANKQTKTLKSLPAKYDLRDNNWVTPVKNQGNRGACWEFAGIGAIESHWLKNGYGEYDLSELNVGTCHGFEWGIDDGGNAYLFSAYLTRLQGPVLEEDDPYSPEDFDNPDYNPTCTDVGKPPVAYVPEVRWLPKDNELIKEIIMEHGAVAANMHQSENIYDYLSSTDHTFYYNGSGEPNHAILIVGWDDDMPVTGGTESPDVDNGAWIVKNSFGTEQLDDGYFYISYSDTRVLSEAYYFPVREEYDEADVLHYYDRLGLVSPFMGVQKKIAFALTKFETAEEQQVSKIGTYITSSGTFVDITVYDTKNGNELTDVLAYSERHICKYPGYYRFDIPFKVNGDFYVKLKYYTNNFTYPLIPAEQYVEGFAHPQIESGVNWVSADGENWTAVGSNVDDAEVDLCTRVYAKSTTKPVALFSTDRTEVCVGSTLTISDQSFNTIETYAWDFGADATPATSDATGEQSVTYSTTGTKTITLTVTSVGETSVYKKEIEVVNSLSIQLYATNTVVPTGSDVELWAFADADSYEWKMGTTPLGLPSVSGVTVAPEVLPGMQSWEWNYTVDVTQGNCAGSKTVTITAVVPPDNDNACDALELNYEEVVNGKNDNATVEISEPHPDTTGVFTKHPVYNFLICDVPGKWCNEYGGEIIHHSVWYKFTANSSEASIDTRGMDTKIAVYEAASCENLFVEGNYTLVGAYDDFHIGDSDHGEGALPDIDLTQGNQYWVQVDNSGGINGETGSFTIKLSGTIMNIPIADNKTNGTIYPNPGNGKFILVFDLPKTGATVQVFNTEGKFVSQKNIDAANHIKNYNSTIEIKNSGMYFVKVITETVKVHKIIVR